MELGIDGNTLQVHGESPQEIAIASSAVRTDNQSNHEGGDDQKQSRQFLRDLHLQILSERVLGIRFGDEDGMFCTHHSTCNIRGESDS